jgi:hypothetical protein
LDPQPLDECPKPKSGKSWDHFGGKINWFRPKKESLKGELMLGRTKMQARDQHKVQLKDSICIEFLFCELEKNLALQGESCIVHTKT